MDTSELQIRFQYPNRMAPAVYKALSAKGATRRHWRVLSVHRWEIWSFSPETWEAASHFVRGLFDGLSPVAVIELGEFRNGRMYWHRIQSEGETE